MKTMFFRSTAVIALAVPGVAHAQSTGSIDFDEPEIVVTAERADDVGGFAVPNSAKAKQVLEEEAIRRARPGQTINDIVNLVPGVSFQNNDPWGSSGGGFTIRGFSADRVSQTLDGLPLNDSGNYALYTNQQVDSEVLESVNVNLGATDVDSPTASAAGGTINIRTRTPRDEFHITTTLTVGDVFAENDFDSSLYMRGFGMIDFGDFTGMGTKAFLSASHTYYGVPYNPYGNIKKTQFNGRIWQDLGDNGDFIAVSGHYNRNRNNFAGSESLEALLDPSSADDRFSIYAEDEVYPCRVDPRVLIGGSGSPGESVDYDDRNGCGSSFYRRFNPSNTGNIRGASRFTLADNLIFTFDPSYQYVKANGGGPDDLREGFFTIDDTGYTGAFRGGYYFGRDLNNDGDLDDEVAGNDPSQTQTNRYGVVANLIYDINDLNRFRVAYTWDRARHRQTGQITNMLSDGRISNVFAIDNPLLDVNGNEVNKRDRLSFAILHQVSAEYRGRFMDERLTAVLGLRAPFFTRELNQNCYTTSDNGFVDCPNPGFDITDYEDANPNAVAPRSRTLKYDKLLPNVGFTFELTPTTSIFGNYAKGLSVPGTDPLYASLFFDDNDSGANPVPETTDSFDIGLRWQSGKVQAQLGAYYTKYNNRLATAFDPDANDGEGARVFRNLGKVDKYGVDGSIAYRPTRNSLIYVFGSYNDSEIADDIGIGACRSFQVGDPRYSCATAGEQGFLLTGGKAESGSPQFSVGARGQLSFGGLDLGAQVKHTGPRFNNDTNTDIPGELRDGTPFTFDAKVPSYTLVDFDLRYRLGEFINGTDAAIQLNVTNVFDEYYVGFFGGSLDGFGFAQIGAPRAASLSLILGY